MKMGFSLGRCIRDIVKGLVDIDDVVVIVAGTHIENYESLQRIITEYMQRWDYLKGLNEAECQGVASVLWREGKLHQPRMFGNNRRHVNEISVWADLIPTGGFKEPMVQDAWQAYRSMLTLTGSKPSKEEAEFSWKQ